MASEGSFFDPSQFKSIQLKFAVKNSTAHKEVRQQNKVKLVELLDNGLVLEVPGPFCAKGHKLLVHIDVENAKTAVPRLVLSLKVEELQTFPDNTEKVKATLFQADKEQWEMFCNVFSERQAEILEFFRMVKGA